MTETRLTQLCKCGNTLIVTETIYSENPPDFEIQCQTDSAGKLTAYLGPRARYGWPNSVFCHECHRRQRLENFKKGV